MGCGGTKSAVNPFPRSPGDGTESANSSVYDESICTWRIFSTESDCIAKYTADGTLTAQCSKEHLELRTLLDEPDAVEAMGDYAEQLEMADSLRCWLAIQDLKCNDSGREALLRNAEEIFDKYLKNLEESKLDFLDPMNVELVREAIGKYVTASPPSSPMTPTTFTFRKRIDGTKSPSNLSLKSPENLQFSPTYDDVFALNAIQCNCFLIFFVDVFVKFKQCPEYSKLVKGLKSKYNYCQPDDFIFLDKLGEGSFGVVVHVKKKSTGKHYAMKIQTKITLLNQFLEDPVKVDYEKQALSACFHPFIAHMDYAFDTATLAVIVLEYCNGIDMTKVMKQSPNGRIAESRVCFIAAEVISALIYMHNKGLLYRDLKPGNILLNADGHVQLIDLGTVGDIEGECLAASDPMESGLIAHNNSGKKSYNSPSKIEGSDSGDSDDGFFTIPLPKRAMSVVGTFAFMAPEIQIMLSQMDGEKQGYSNAVDYWSLGATIYNLAAGYQPFSGSKTTVTSKSAEKRSIVYNLTYPDFFSEEIKSLIGKLLDKNPMTRLTDGDVIKRHPFFSSIFWDKLEKKLSLPPYIPDLEESRKVASYENFADMMNSLGLEDWLTCVPPPSLDKYFNNWKYVAGKVVPVEQVITERKLAARAEAYSNARISHSRSNYSDRSVVSGLGPIAAKHSSGIKSLKSTEFHCPDVSVQHDAAVDAGFDQLVKHKLTHSVTLPSADEGDLGISRMSSLGLAVH